jgi:TonB family protein
MLRLNLDNLGSEQETNGNRPAATLIRRSFEPEPEVSVPDPNQLQLFQPLPAEPLRPVPEPHLHLLLELEEEVERWRFRSFVLVSIFLHIIFVLMLTVAPDLLGRALGLVHLQAENRNQQVPTFIEMPPDLEQRLRELRTKPNILSDKNREAQGKSPKVNPNGIHAPYSKGNTPLPEQQRGGPPPAPKPAPAAPASPPPQQAQQPAERADAGKGHPEPKRQEIEKPKLEDVEPAGGSEHAELRMPFSTPGEAIRESAVAAARGRALSGQGGGPGAGESTGQFNNFNPNFSTEGPVILSDTRGVDFGPYLARVVSAVRRNWYAVIPESARLGQRGRVAIVFEIIRDGSVPQIRLVSGSGFYPLDQAALSGIRASIPFPPLPQEFTGEHLVLQFMFLYNLGLTQ